MIGNIADYYLSVYGSRELTRTDTHKRSELKSIYNNIVRMSRRSPLYKVDATPEVQRYAIDLKESARSIINSASSIDSYDPLSKSFTNKKAASSDENVLTVSYIGDDLGTSEALNSDYELFVNQLATKQTNTGKYLSPNGKALSEGEYIFDLNINSYSYEFQFNVNSDDTNESIQNKLTRLINRSNTGLTAEVLSNDAGENAISISSKNFGIEGLERLQFTFTENEKNTSKSPISTLGLAQVSTLPQNAIFSINGNENTATSNTFTINKKFEIHLLSKNADATDPVKIGFKPNIDVIKDNINDVVGRFNDIVDLVSRNKADNHDTHRLSNELNSLVEKYRNDFESTGLMIDESGKLGIDEALLIQSINEGTLKDSLSKVNDFRSDLLDKASSISLNPMNYVKKTLISYPNPSRSFSNPYATSIYSGMMFNGYI